MKSSGFIFFLLAFYLVGLFSINGFSQKTFYSKKIEDWKNHKPDTNSKVNYSIFLIGDLKNPCTENKVLDLLQTQINEAGKNSTLIVLGDILYQVGLPDSGNSGFLEAEKKMNFILSKLCNYEGNVFFIPGNHDWAQGRKQGWKNLRNLENYIEKKLNKGNVFLPDGGCPGPVGIHLNDEIVIIAFDYQWFLHKHNKPHPKYHCDCDEDFDFFVSFEDAIRRNSHKQIVIASHFPIYSVGNHGGYFPPLYSIFPLLERNKYFYLPLPGFVYTGYRKFFGSMQDLAHPDYNYLKNLIWNIVSNHPNIIYTAGHEHNLQYVFKDSVHHIISGGGGEGTYISCRKKKADFAAASEGFCRIDYYENGSVWVKFLKPFNDNCKTLFEKKLYNKIIFTEDYKLEKQIDFSDSVVYKSLSDIYEKDKSSKFFMGENYRKEWNTKVSYPVFDIGSEKGGLKIKKRGGGQQSISVRLEDKNGKEYVLRSVNKNVEKAIDKNMRNTFIQGIVQDGISASHPFAALTVPELADAVGVFHTNPKLVWLPNDERFGIYGNDIANNIFLFEERPAGNSEGIKSFGYSKKIISTPKLIKKIQNKSNHSVDQKSVLKARLLDILINDWDRHDDQWRWASFSKNGKTIYKPIPRDRDQVYFVNEGLLMWIIKQDFLMPKFQGFDHKIRNVKGLGYNARFFDRSFLTQPELHEWINEARFFQSAINDSVIDEALNMLPAEIFDLSANEIKEKLKSRLKDFPKYAKQYYLFLSKKVDIVGTNDRDYFKVERKKNGDLLVSVYELSNKKGKIKKLKYQRNFKLDETKEVRLYGLGGKDKFDVSGQAKKGIKLRQIGGKGNDVFHDNSFVKGMSRKNQIYDRSDKKNKFESGKESKLKLSKNPLINQYNRKQFKYNEIIPLISTGYNINDGMYLGAGANIKQYNFRDSTFQKISGQYSYSSNAFSVKYNGLFSSVFRNSIFLLNAEISMPKNVDNFFGFGNNSEKVSNNKSYYRVPYKLIVLNTMIKKYLGKKSYISAGGFYKYIFLEDTTNRYIGKLYPEKIGPNVFKAKNYFGLNAVLDVDNRNNKMNPIRGSRWNSEACAYVDLNGYGFDFIKIMSDISLYISFKRDPRFVFALSLGGAVNFGKYDFLHANHLGGNNHLRGFLNNRFAGDALLYQNSELRIKLLNIRKYYFVGQWGFLIFNDLGKVWYDGKSTPTWHNGYGFGTWLTPFNATIINLSYNISDEENYITLNLKFSF